MVSMTSLVTKHDILTTNIGGIIMEWMSRTCCMLLCRYEIIRKEESDIYIYGFELLFTTLLSAFSILGLSFIMDEISVGFIFIIFFFTIRLFTGGYHADTHIGCFVITNLIYITYLRLGNLMLDLPLYINILAGTVVITYIWIRAPIIHPNQPLSDKKRQNNKKYTHVSLILAIIMMVSFYCFGLLRYVATLEAIIILTGMMMLIKPKRRRKYVEIT